MLDFLCYADRNDIILTCDVAGVPSKHGKARRNGGGAMHGMPRAVAYRGRKGHHACTVALIFRMYE